MRSVRQSVKPAAVVMVFVMSYFCPSVPPESVIVAVVVVWLSESFVMPGGTAQELVTITSPPANQADQSIW